MEMLCDTCVNGYDLGAPDLSCKECQTAKIERDDSDYVTKCSRYKQKPMLNIKDPDDQTANGQMLDKSQKKNMIMCDFCALRNTLSCTMATKKLNVLGQVYECNGFHNIDTIQISKPPEGAKPYYIVAGNRIHELAEAIDRYSDTPKGNLSCIKKWAKEIIAQCDLIEKCEEEQL